MSGLTAFFLRSSRPPFALRFDQAGECGLEAAMVVRLFVGQLLGRAELPDEPFVCNAADPQGAAVQPVLLALAAITLIAAGVGTERRARLAFAMALRRGEHARV